MTAHPVHTIGLLLSRHIDRQLLGDYLRDMGYAVALANAVESIETMAEQCSLLLADEQTARVAYQQLIACKVRPDHVFLPCLIVLPQNTDSSAWLRVGFDDVLRIPLIKAELRARLEVFLRVREQSAALVSATNRRFRALVDHISDGITLFNERGHIIYQSPSTTRLSGYAPNERLGQSVLDLIHPDDQELARNALATLLQMPNGTLSIQYRSLHADGSWHWVEAVATNMLHEPELQAIIANFRDITERKHADAVRAQLAAIVESSDDAIYSKTLDGVITSWNDGAERLYGYGPQEAIGLSAAKLMAPDRQTEELDVLERIRRGERVRHIETVRLRNDGRSVDVSITISPMKDASGQVVGASSIARDIADQRRAEAALRQSEKRFATAFHASPAAMMISHLQSGRIIDVNDSYSRISGYDRDELIGSTTLKLKIWKHPDKREQVVRIISTLGSLRDHEVTIRTKSGATRHTLCSLEAIELDGEACLLSIVFDITERKQAEGEISRLNAELEHRVLERTAELERANRELEAFSYSVSHDLRAPLRSIDGFSRIVLESYAQDVPQEAQHYLQRVRSNAQKMGHLIDDLLGFARLSRQPLAKRTVAPAGIVEECLDDLRAEHDGRHINVRVGDLPPCEADPALLKQVWVNMLANAFKYTREREQALIEVGSRREHGIDIYFVKDNGTGFDMRYASKLFGVFQRLHRAEAYEGTGVGLAIVQRIVHRHGGRVWAEAEVNQGAMFAFTLTGEHHGSASG